MSQFCQNGIRGFISHLIITSATLVLILDLINILYNKNTFAKMEVVCLNQHSARCSEHQAVFSLAQSPRMNRNYTIVFKTKPAVFAKLRVSGSLCYANYNGAPKFAVILTPWMLVAQKTCIPNRSVKNDLTNSIENVCCFMALLFLDCNENV